MAYERYRDDMRTFESQNKNTFLHYLAYAPLYVNYLRQLVIDMMEQDPGRDPQQLGRRNGVGVTAERIAQRIGNTRAAEILSVAKELLRETEVPVDNIGDIMRNL